MNTLKHSLYTLFFAKNKPKLWIGLFNFILVLLFIGGVFWLSLKILGVILSFNFLIDFRVRLFRGFLMTLAVGSLSMIVSLIIGIVAAIGQNASFYPSATFQLFMFSLLEVPR